MPLKSFQVNSVFKSKPDSLSSAPSGPNSIQTKHPFSFLLSPLKSTVMRSRLKVYYKPPAPPVRTHPTLPHSRRDLFESPKPRSVYQYQGIKHRPHTLGHTRQTEGPVCSVAFGVISLAVDRSSEGSSVITGSLRWRQGERTLKKGTGA